MILHWNCALNGKIHRAPQDLSGFCVQSVAGGYGERTFRYFQHDLGHALAAVSFSAATLGWKARLATVHPEYLAWLLRLEPPAHPLEPEIPEALV